MSNYLAVATVTASIAQVLLNAFGSASPEISGATVTTGKPEAVKPHSTFVGANLYLFQIGPNLAYRNSDLATRNSNGTLLQRPQVALDLNYLLTFYGDETKFEPQLLLGCAVSALHAQPVLTREIIDSAVRYNAEALGQSDLAGQIESVKVAPLYLSLEEWSKLWTVFFQATHVLSVCYQCSVVLIDADVPAPAPALPVRGASLGAVASMPPVVERIEAQPAGAPIIPGATLLVTGRGFGGTSTRVRLSGVEVPVTSVASDGTSLTLALPHGVVRAGAQTLQIVRDTPAGASGATVPVESNVASFTLLPKIVRARVSAGADAPTMIVRLDPAVGATQQLSVLLNEQTRARPAPPASYTLPVGPRDEDTARLPVSIAGVAPGTYLVRVRVDGADSPLEVDTDPNSPTYNRYVGPRVSIRRRRRGAKSDE